MNRNRTILFAILAVVTIVAAVLFSFLSSPLKSKIQIQLPAELPGSALDAESAKISSAPAPQIVELNADNLFEILESLNRPENYSLDLYVTVSWSGGQVSSRRQMYRSRDMYRMILQDEELSYIIDGEYTYIWENGARMYTRLKTGNFTPDDNLQIPTYETLLERKDEKVTFCQYVERDGEPCIQLRTVKAGQSESKGRSESEWWISLSSGLLLESSIYQDGTEVYRMLVVSVSTEQPDSKYFSLPR